MLACCAPSRQCVGYGSNRNENEMLSAEQHLKIAEYVNANVWDGEDRSGCKNDCASFDPDELQELIVDTCNYIINDTENIK